MEISFEQLEQSILTYVDQIKVLIAPETWENIVLNCSKNELLIFLLLYQRGEVSMSQIAEYINVPLNTATGVVDRMEKKKVIRRERRQEDKRVVTIVLTELGKQQIQSIIEEFLYYGSKVLAYLTVEEFALLERVMGKVIGVLKEGHKTEEAVPTKKLKKIVIE